MSTRDRLASDVRRTMTASLVGGIASGVTVLVLRPQTLALSRDVVLVYLVLFAVSFAAYAVLTRWVFAGRSRAELGRLVAATQVRPESGWKRLLRRYSGSDAHSWGLEIVALSLGAVTLIALLPGLRRDVWLVVLSTALVVSGWFAMLAAYASTYLRHDVTKRQLRFPGDDEPVWDDYVYLTAQLQATFSGSDVEVLSTPMRRLVTVHSLLSFGFSTVVVALLVSALLAVG